MQMLQTHRASARIQRTILAAVLMASLLMVVGVLLVGCSSQPSEQQGDEASANTPKTVLVAYYSATGSTQAVAEKIAAHLDADLFEIVPVEPYSQDDLNYNDEQSRVVKEHEAPELQDVALATTTPENFDQYETVFIGYPLWWGQAAWPVDSFVVDNDFSGKTVIPFCTSASSPLGSSAQNLHALNQTGTWLDGVRFSSSATQDDVDEWITGQVEPALSNN